MRPSSLIVIAGPIVISVALASSEPGETRRLVHPATGEDALRAAVPLSVANRIVLAPQRPLERQTPRAAERSVVLVTHRASDAQGATDDTVALQRAALMRRVRQQLVGTPAEPRNSVVPVVMADLAEATQ